MKTENRNYEGGGEQEDHSHWHCEAKVEFMYFQLTKYQPRSSVTNQTKHNWLTDHMPLFALEFHKWGLR